MLLNNLLNAKKNNLTFIRACLSIIVIYSHSFPLTGTAMNNELFFKFSNCYGGGGIAVATFFFISGALITKSYLKDENPVEFTISRLFRLMPALFVAAIFITFIAGPLVSVLSFKEYFGNKYIYQFIYNNLIFNTDFYLPGVFENLYFPGGIIGSWWTLRYEFFCYFVLLMLGMLGIFNNRNLCLLIGCIYIYLTITDLDLIKQFFMNDGSKEIYYLPLYFIFGSLCFLFGNIIKINFKVIIAIVGLTFFLKDTLAYNYLFLISCFFVSLWLSISPLIMKLKMKHDISYGVYIYGFFIQQLFVYWIPSLNSNINFLLSVLVCIPIGLLSAIYIEEPSIKLGKKIIEKINFYIELKKSKDYL